MGKRHPAGPKPPAFTLRAARARDEPVLYACYKRTMREYVELTWGWNEGFQSAAFRENLPWRRFRIIEVAGAFAGAACAREADDHIELEMMMIEPGFQRRGIGTDYVALLLDRAHARGLDVALRVMKVNPAKALYERLGFKLVGEDAGTFEMRAVMAPEG